MRFFSLILAVVLVLVTRTQFAGKRVYGYEEEYRMNMTQQLYDEEEEYRMNMTQQLYDEEGVGRSLPRSCTSRLNPTSCFFPQHVIETVKTPLVLVNTDYDTWQVLDSLIPLSADPHGYWSQCRKNYANYGSWKINFFQGFRHQMLSAIRGFSWSSQNGFFINSCYAHCQTESQDTWFAPKSPHIGNKGIAESIGNWYFYHGIIREIDCAYPCDNSCHNLAFP